MQLFSRDVTTLERRIWQFNADDVIRQQIALEVSPETNLGTSNNGNLITAMNKYIYVSGDDLRQIPSPKQKRPPQQGTYSVVSKYYFRVVFPTSQDRSSGSYAPEINPKITCSNMKILTNMINSPPQPERTIHSNHRGKKRGKITASLQTKWSFFCDRDLRVRICGLSCVSFILFLM